jgi:hypothetical protein
MDTIDTEVVELQNEQFKSRFNNYFDKELAELELEKSDFENISKDIKDKINILFEQSSRRSSSSSNSLAISNLLSGLITAKKNKSDLIVKQIDIKKQIVDLELKASRASLVNDEDNFYKLAHEYYKLIDDNEDDSEKENFDSNDEELLEQAAQAALNDFSSNKNSKKSVKEEYIVSTDGVIYTIDEEGEIIQKIDKNPGIKIITDSESEKVVRAYWNINKKEVDVYEIEE